MMSGAAFHEWCAGSERLQVGKDVFAGCKLIYLQPVCHPEFFKF
jgi:hypothetical protein